MMNKHVITYPTTDDYRNARTSSVFADMESYAQYVEIPCWYKWSKDPLHHWSRVWEYPWVYSQIRGDTILDAGSGVTFFPGWLRSKEYKVDTLDHNPWIANWTGGIEGNLTTYKTVKQWDTVMCISVIEHLDDYLAAAETLSRLVKPGRRLILTIDVALDQHAAMQFPDLRQLVQLFYPRDTIEAPNRVTGMTTRNVREGLPGPTHIFKKAISLVKHLHPLGHLPYLTVAGLIWDKPLK